MLTTRCRAASTWPSCAPLVESAGLQVEHWHGVRLLADLVPSTSIDTDAERAALVALEEALAGHPAYPFLGELGAALHLLARRG